ncbi:MAG TPA: hypothetical protein VFZ69_05810 [Longimicrobiales bacterium]
MRGKLSAVTMLILGACAWRAPPVPVLGDPGDRLQLAGEWSGEYWSSESGRSGSILFRLSAGADSATGDVLMIQQSPSIQSRPEQPVPASQAIPITFVRVAGDRVRGVLAPYRDPACGCLLETAFEGELRDDAITGTYRSRHVDTGAVQTGQWRVRRTREPGAGAAGAAG